MVDLLFHVRDNASGAIYPIGIYRGVPVQADQIFNVGSITPNKAYGSLQGTVNHLFLTPH